MQIELSDDEALILFEFLSRFKNDGALSFVDQAEERALWNFAAALEKVLVAPFSENYNDLIAEARHRLRAQEL